MRPKEELRKLSETESKTMFHVLQLYGYRVYRYKGGHFIVPFEVTSYEEMRTKNFVFVEFLSESFPTIRVCVKGKIKRISTPDLKVLYSSEDIRLISIGFDEVVLKNKTGESVMYTGVYEGEELT